MKADCTVIVFAKAPQAGFAKTRLIPALGEKGAAQLAEHLLAWSIDQACKAHIGPVELCCTPDATHAAFERMKHLQRSYGLRLTVQGDGDLGQRMARALRRVLLAQRAAILIGTDAPGLDAAYLRSARAGLADHDAVFGPATDGGYTLVGLKQPADELFQGINWSTPQVMAQTRQRLTQLGLHGRELPALSDIDEPADLAHLPADWLSFFEPELK